MSIILGFHGQVPYGAGDDECELIYNTRLKPFISALNKYPKIPATLYYSGVFLNWLENSHPEFVMVLEDLISRKQVELLGGGFYEPMMPLIPQTDKIGQIEMFTAYLRKKFGKRPQGCWIPDSVWEQSLVSVLSTCGMGYTFLEETHFISAGLSGEALYAPCISESQGKTITIFPLSVRFPQELARTPVAQVLEEMIRDVPPGGLVTIFPEHLYAGDSEEVSEAVYSRFFEALYGSAGIMEFTTPGKFYKTLGRLKKAYFPGDQERNFLILHPEANGIYAKMMFIHTIINQLRGDKARKQNAREELWKAQGYTLFSKAGTGDAGNGGIYRAFFRKAVYKALIGAEKICRSHGKFIPSLLVFDFDLDGRDEYLFQDRNINCYVRTLGASIFELDYFPKAWNYLDAFARRRGAPAEEPVVEDGYRRAAFSDRLTLPDFSFRDALESRFAGSRFCGEEWYELVEMDRSHGQARFRLPPGEAGNGLDRIEIEKGYVLKQDTLRVNYGLINRGAHSLTFQFIPQVDLSFPGDSEDLLKVFRSHAQDHEPAAREGLEINGLRGIEFRDIKNEVTLSLTSDRDFNGWVLPIRTRLRIRDAVIDQYQSTCLMPVMRVSLEQGERWDTEFQLNISH